MNSLCEDCVGTGKSAKSTRPHSRKRRVRRITPDSSQQLRRLVQVLFLLLNLWIGVEFYFFVQYFENGGAAKYVPRPAGVEGWLPIAALMNLKYVLFTGRIPPLHPAAMFLLIAFLAISWLFRKSFCSWLCPVGTLSEALWKMGQRLWRWNLTLHRWVDLPLRSLKYILLGLFAYAVASLSSPAILDFMQSPYGLIADVKMLNFFRHLGTTATWVLAFLMIASVFIKNFWCRYLCPYGALMGITALSSPSSVRRDPEVCVDCAKCTRVCPSLLPVDKLLVVRSAECTGCLECVAVCPAQGALQMKLGKKRDLPVWAMTAAICLLFLAIVGYAKWTGHWQSAIPDRVYLDLVPRAHELAHP